MVETIEYIIGFAIYLFAGMAFLGIAYTPIKNSVMGAETGAVTNVADSLKLQFDSLSSGGSVTLVWTQRNIAVSLSGRSIIASYQSITVTRLSTWILPTMTLDPSKTYVASLNGNMVNITS